MLFRSRLLPVFLCLRDAASAAVDAGFEAGACDVLAADADAHGSRVRLRAAVDRRRAWEQVIIERQRDTLLELAGAVAHRINQPLTSMSVIVETLNAQHARGELETARLALRLAELQRLVERMATIVKKVSTLVDYRTVPYIGDVRIIDLDPERRGESSDR